MHQDKFAEPRAGSATVYLIVGLPGAGKTTRAKELELEASALRLTPDEWQIALFDYDNPPDKRDLVEGKLIEVGMRAAQLGTNVVFDFGFWSTDERSALRWIAGALGAHSTVVYLPITPEEQRDRITRRFATTPEQTFSMSDRRTGRVAHPLRSPRTSRAPRHPHPARPAGLSHLVSVGFRPLAVPSRARSRIQSYKESAISTRRSASPRNSSR